MSKQQITMVAVLLSGAFIAVLNQTLLTPALPTIMSHLDVSATTVQWLTSGYSLVEAVLIGSSVLMPMFIQNALGESATVSGLLMLPGAVGGAICGLVAGGLFDKFGIRRVSLAGAAVLLAGTAGYLLFKPSTPVAAVCIVYAVACCGLQFLVTPVNTWGINSLSNGEVPHGNAIVSTMEQVGSSFGTAFVVSLTALSSFVPGAQTAAEQSFAGCIFGFGGLFALVAAIALSIVFFAKDKKAEEPASDAGAVRAENR